MKIITHLAEETCAHRLINLNPHVMLRKFAIAALLSCFAAAGWAQSPSTSSAPATSSPAGLGTNKLQSRAETEARSVRSDEMGQCQIGVVPIAGNLFMIERIGPITSSNTYVRAAADGWGLDELVVSRVRAAAPGAAVRRIAFSREELVRARDSESLFRNVSSELRDFVRHVAAGTSCDRYVLVHRTGGGKQPFGIGIVEFVNLTDRRVFLFVLMGVRVYDGRTFELIKEAPARIDNESLLARAYLNPVGGPYRALDERSFPVSRAEAVASPILREGVRALLAESLDKTLPALLGQSAKGD